MARKSPNKTNRPEDSRIYADPAPERRPNIDFSILTEEEREAITAEAKRLVDERERKRTVEAYLKAEEERLELEAHPEIEEEKREILVDLPEFSDAIRLDGKVSPHGWRGEVQVSKYATMQEIMYRARCHDDEVSGRNERARTWRRSLHSRGTEISGANGVSHGNAPRF